MYQYERREFLLNARFKLAENYLRTGPPLANASASDRAHLQALWHQAVDGPLCISGMQCPPPDDLRGRLQWYHWCLNCNLIHRDAWKELGDMLKDEAKHSFISTLSELAHDWLSWSGNASLASNLVRAVCLCFFLSLTV